MGLFHAPAYVKEYAPPCRKVRLELIQMVAKNSLLCLVSITDSVPAYEAVEIWVQIPSEAPLIWTNSTKVSAFGS